jgi:hypothetical protein
MGPDPRREELHAERTCWKWSGSTVPVVIPVHQPPCLPKWIQRGIQAVVQTGAAVGSQQRLGLPDFFVGERAAVRLE